MSLQDAIKEVEKEEKKALGVEQAEPPEPKEDAPEPVDDAPAEPPAEELADKKEPPAEDKAPENADFARLRREKAASDRRAAAAEEALKRQPAKPAEAPKPADVDAEPDQNTDPEAHLRWELRQARNELKGLSDWRQSEEKKQQKKSVKDNAVKAFGGYEEAFKPTVTDYDDVMDFGVKAISASIRTLNPMLKGEELGNAIQLQILRMAGTAEAQGHDPAEYLYHQAKAWGYKPKEAPAEEGDGKTEEKAKPSFKSIVDSKKKSASSLTPGGKNGKIPLSREAVLDKNFGLQDFAKLSPEQLKELESLEA